MDPNLYCGECYFCRQEQSNHCLNWQGVGITRPGGFAEYVAVPARACYQVPPEITDTQAAFVEPLSCVIHALKRLRVWPGDEVLIFGAGPMGLLLVQALRRSGVGVKVLTGDNARAAQHIAEQTGITDVRAGLKPEDKVAQVRELAERYGRVAMVGDGVNDAPALAQADAGIAIAPLSAGGPGSDMAVEAAHVVLMREDWSLIPQVFEIARRTLRVVKTNIAFTAVYNIAGLSLAAFGILPPILAAAAQSLPDIGILANSSRLIRQ